MMTVYFVVMAICSGNEGCVEERKPGPTYATKEICMETTRDMTPRKGVKFKCRRERLLVVPNEMPHAAGFESVVSTGAKGQP
ncbi:hypothetical protein BK653_30515 [Pseudomonas brassicacearum]|uniref:hypothetical protein n=1 Tax=Pseudomonas brassicacearum TaxID=930166 RepID=UPI000F47A7D9|nr:hypothetical protein [Pseudomonas brassicacearum]ROM61982.1 hypothetical protein BK653_30515 [Pseudomonas brassicacearum]